MRPFRYERASSAEEALALIAAEPRARFLAGGTNLVDLMRLEVETPDVLIDVTSLENDRIEDVDGGGLRIGASVANSDAAGDRRVRERYPVLSQALLNGASGQLRNLATVGGNLLQRTRCAYFQDVTKPCNKRDPGSGCPAREGDHRNLAVIGHSQHCVATHPSDMAVALAALDAVVHVRSVSGERAIPMVGFHRLPGDEPQRDTVLEPGELITAVELPPVDGAFASIYRKARERRSFAFALVSIAAMVELDDDGVVAAARIAFGGLAHVPWRAARAEQALRGERLGEDVLRRAADAELAQARPLPDNGYKVRLARNLLVSTMLDLARSR